MQTADSSESDSSVEDVGNDAEEISLEVNDTVLPRDKKRKRCLLTKDTVADIRKFFSQGSTINSCTNCKRLRNPLYYCVQVIIRSFVLSC